MVGTKHANILTSTVLSDLSACRFRGEALIDLFPRLYALLEAALGSDGASLLALPECGFSKVRQAKTVTWYTDRIGAFRSLEALSQEERTAAESQLRERVRLAIERVDPEARRLLQAALNLPSGEDIWFDGETVVLTNWGFVKNTPDGQSHPSPMSAFLPAGFTLTQEFAEPVGGGETVGGELDADAPQPGLASVASAPGQTAPPEESVPIASRMSSLRQTASPATAELGQAAHGGSYRRAAIWLAGVPIILAIFLLYLLWPGNLIYPSLAAEGTTTAVIDEQQQNDALRGQIARLQSSLGANVCTAPNADELDGIAGMPVLPQAPMSPIGGSGANNIPSDAGSIGQATPPAPAVEPAVRSETTEGVAAPLRGEDLINSLENGTVFVVGSLGDNLSLGSGFLVTPKLVLTNHHVVAGVQEGKLLVANRHLPKPLHARVVATSPGSDYAAEDFALLELEQETQLPRLALSSAVERLDSVIAAGYPSFVVSSDPSFVTAFHEGRLDSLSNIQLALTRGEVTVMQPGPTGATVLAHSATISPGNSGGPLVDRCGRVVGVNTFTKTEAESALRLNYALSTSDAVRFLNGHGVNITANPAACGDGPPAISPALPATSAQAAAAPNANPGSAADSDTAPATPPQAGHAAPSAPTTPTPASTAAPPATPMAPPAPSATPAPASPPPANEADDLIAPTEPGQ